MTAVEEFFQLFKTPWEPFQPGADYDVVLAVSDRVPDVDVRLLIIFGSEAGSDDARRKITAASRRPEATLRYQGQRVPIYGGALTFAENSSGVACLHGDSGVAGLRFDSAERTVLRVGYDLFKEIGLLLSAGQPAENAGSPTLEIHIRMLRDWMLGAGISFVEIPPVPAGYRFAVCLTHDIDFVGIRRHKFDHTMAGFLYRATVGALRDFLSGKQSLRRLAANWCAAASLPFVYLGWAKDFWLQFDAYLQIEKGLSATYYFIPFKKRPGGKLAVKHPGRRATAYDIADIPELIETLTKEGCEIGVHGIDAWHSVVQGREELARVAAATGQTEAGIRMHWLLRDENTMRVLEEAGYDYDSTLGYNETVGYRCGTSQAFCPPGVRRLLELPMHIQDGALFYPQRLGLSESEAWQRCEALIQNAREFGGTLTVLWHDRSLGPERFWGDFYIRLVNRLRSMEVWFANARQVVGWFRMRREVSFERLTSPAGSHRVKLCYRGRKIVPPLVVRVQRPGVSHEQPSTRSGEMPGTEDIPWTGESDLDVQLLKGNATEKSAQPAMATTSLPA